MNDVTDMIPTNSYSQLHSLLSLLTRRCNVTAGVCIKKDNTRDNTCAAYTTLPPVTSSSLRTARAFKFGRMEVVSKKKEEEEGRERELGWLA